VFTDGRQRQPNRGYVFFLKKYSDSQCCWKKYSDFGGGKKNNLIHSFCHITYCWILEKKIAVCATKKINILTLELSGNDHILCLLTDDNDNPIIIRPHIVFTDGRQRQLNHNTTTYCVYWQKKTTTQSLYDHILCLLTDDNNDNPIIIQYVVVLWLGCCCCRLSVNTICGHIIIGLSLLSSISKHNMWSYYDWVVVAVVRQLTQYVVVLWLGCRCCRPSVSAICGHVMIGLSLLSSVSYCVYWRTRTTTQS
jgi:hypothetical protein